jgi:hypothetical protein
MQDYIFKNMHRIFVFLVLWLIIPVKGIYAQIREVNKVEFPQDYSWVLKTNPLAMLQGPIPLTNEFRLVSEIVVAPTQSSEIGISLLGKSVFYSLFDTVTGPPKIIVSGFRFQISHRFYFNQPLRALQIYVPEYAPQGLYIGPLFSYSTARFTDSFNSRFDRYYRITHTNLNLIFGYQHITPSNITFDFFTGFGYKENNWIFHSPSAITNVSMDDMWPYYRSNLKLIFGWNVGYAF